MTVFDYISAAIAADSTGITTVGIAGRLFPNKTAEALVVYVEQTSASDADFNVEVGGNDIFSTEQSVGSADTVERLVPGQNQYVQAGDRIEVDVSAASGTAGSELNLTVTTDDNFGE